MSNVEKRDGIEPVQPAVELVNYGRSEPRQSDITEVMHDTSQLVEGVADNANLLDGEEAPLTPEELERMQNEAVVMLVDDEQLLTKTMVRCLRGFKNVSVFGNPEEALAQIIKEGRIAVTPDLIITDCEMPGYMSGGKFFLELQNIQFEIPPQFMAASGNINVSGNKESKRIFEERGIQVSVKPDFIMNGGFLKSVIATLRRHPRFAGK
jgi:CheY-like chemotaxis protein